MGNSSSDDCALQLAQQRASMELERERIRAAAALQEARLKAEMEKNKLQHQLALKEKEAAHKVAMEKVKRAQIGELQQRLTWLQQQLNDECKLSDQIQSQLVAVRAQIATEEKDIAAFKPERDDANTKIVVLIGMTGAGKSTFCNRLYGDTSEDADQGPFETSFASTSCTQRHSKRIIEIVGHRVTVVDTPGYNDSTGRDDEHCNKLCKYMKGCPGINAFVLIRNGSQIRFDMAFQSMLKQYHDMFGDVFLEKLIIMATKIDGQKALQRFDRNHQGKVLREDICNLFGLNVSTPVVPIGLDAYHQSIEKFVQQIPSDKFKCKHIVSPIEKLKERERLIALEHNEQVEQVNKIQTEIQSTNAKLQRLF
eukprot:CAMPEP_0202705182 /NCGR_PEP_ID=MMETSP1385-20130828/17770_1 /ASSEMBLY_ACC=CAM_ASM_000861 /TAXON_ID=933848 /ORGANISM="Elphidium margaritaceum" /LENGTH=366 /DNA_ID=CAMNT_0049363361 /DNA_START=122 /DNA_END=1222 /DNA_ORIENTATION=+